MFQFTEIMRKTKIRNYDFSINLYIELSFPADSNGPIQLTTLLDNKYSKEDANKDIKPRLSDLPEVLIISFVRGIEGKGVIKTKVLLKKNYL